MNPTPDFGNQTATKAFVGSNVEDLPVVECLGGHISAWELTDEDLATLFATRRIYLWVHGTHHPPVAVTTDPPPPPAASRDGEPHA